jgi:anaerobic nitric oxide reductase transcription regulator
MEQIEALLTIAIDLTAFLASVDRYARLLDTVRRAIPCDAAAVLELRDGDLVPLATHGLSPQVLGLRFPRREHPRLDVVVSRGVPVRFPADSTLPDPFDGLLLATPDARGVVHACLGCPLVERDEVIGVLTADALEPGAFDALSDPFLRMLGALAGAAMHTARLIETLEQLMERRQLVARDLQRDAAVRRGGQILGTSPAIERVRREIDLVARSDFAVLITGETGVGKELVARAIHAASRRCDEALIYLNCAALPESVAESELFGHVRGAFTGAESDRAGKFEVADKGTLFLDEVGELPLSVQPKLLRALQGGEIQRVGSDKPLSADVRVLAATNRDLSKEVEAGRFRADLYHRLNMYPIHVPALRERREDITLLAGFLLDVYRRKLGLGPVRLTEQATRALESASWLGNVRELDHVLGRAALRAGGASPGEGATLIKPEHLQVEDVAIAVPKASDSDVALLATQLHNKTLREAVDEFKRAMVARTVRQYNGNLAKAARALGMQRGNFHHMARRLGLLGQGLSRGQGAGGHGRRGTGTVAHRS